MVNLLISGFYNRDFRLRIFRGLIYAEFWWEYGYLLGVRGYRGSATKILKKLIISLVILRKKFYTKHVWNLI